MQNNKKVKKLAEKLRYKSYKIYEIGEVISIDDNKSTYQKDKDLIYLPIDNTKTVKQTLSNNDINIKNQYIIIKLNTDKVIPEFFCYMLNQTDMGKEIRELISSSSNIGNTVIYLPDMNKQKSTIQIQKSMNSLIDGLDGISVKEGNKYKQTEKQTKQLVSLNSLFSKQTSNIDLEQKINFLNNKIHNSIKSKVEAVKKMLEEYDDSESKIDVETINKIVSYINDECNNLLFVTSKEELNLLSLIEGMKHKTEIVFSTSNVKIDFSHNSDEKSNNKILDSQLTYSVLEIYSELLNNIEKHSYAEKVIIKIEVNTDYLSILIIDNGKDFDLDKFDVQHSNGYGLKIIKSLVEKIDADLEIKSMPFQGSYRKLVIKL